MRESAAGSLPIFRGEGGGQRPQSDRRVRPGKSKIQAERKKDLFMKGMMLSLKGVSEV